MKVFSLDDARALAKQLSIDFDVAGYTVEEFRDGLNVELEHGLRDPETNVTDDDGLKTAKIALAHLKENTKYYDKNVGLMAWERALDKVKGDTEDMRIQIYKIIR